jgi:hypothetical protein
MAVTVNGIESSKVTEKKKKEGEEKREIEKRGSFVFGDGRGLKLYSRV